MNQIGFTPPLPEREIRQLSEGEMPYSLSRLEYLELYLNSFFSYRSKELSVNFLAHPHQNKMVIVIMHSPDVPQESIDTMLQHGRDRIKGFTEARNWNWVTIEKHIECPEI